MDVTTGEKEKQLLAATVRERLIGKKNSVLYKDLLNEKLPTFLNNYLENAVRKLVHTEEPIQLKHSNRFDFSYEKIKILRDSIIQAIEEATIFPKDLLSDIINKTVSLQFDLITRPNSTLIKIFYKKTSDRIQGDILKLLEALDDERIFIKRLIQNIREFDQYHIVIEDFKRIIKKTEKECYFKENLIDNFISDVESLINFLGMIKGYSNNTIKVNLVRLLLNERNLRKYSIAFEKFNSDLIDVEKIKQLLDDCIEIEKDSANNEEDDIDSFFMISEAESTISGHQIKQRFEKQSYSDEKNCNKVTKITNIDQDISSLIIERSKIEEQPDGPIDQLRNLINDKDEKFLLKRIFENDRMEYDEFIGQLENINNWKDAKERIDIELSARSIQPFSKEALRLGDLVFNRYFPEKH